MTVLTMTLCLSLSLDERVGSEIREKAGESSTKMHPRCETTRVAKSTDRVSYLYQQHILAYPHHHLSKTPPPQPFVHALPLFKNNLPGDP